MKRKNMPSTNSPYRSSEEPREPNEKEIFTVQVCFFIMSLLLNAIFYICIGFCEPVKRFSQINAVLFVLTLMFYAHLKTRMNKE